MNIKDRSLMSKLLISLIDENGGKISLKELELLLDDLVNEHNAYPTFESEGDSKVVHWNNEDHVKVLHGSFMKAARDLSKGNDHINITFSPKCSACSMDLKKVKVTKDGYTFRCNYCGVDYLFDVVHTVVPTIQNAEESSDDPPISI